MQNSYYAYWERQGQDKMCAVHTLNALMQGPTFSEIELGTIANGLDREEAQLLGTGSGSYGAGESHNVDADGNFSFAVMERALQQTGLSMINLDKPEVRDKVMKNADSEQAYVCNSHARAHWYCIRRVSGKWYDLDSLKPAPTFISDFHLAAFLEQTMKSGFTVFVIRSEASGMGNSQVLPAPDKNKKRDRPLLPHQMFLNDKDMESLQDEARRKADNDTDAAQRVANGQDPGDGEGGSSKFGQVFDPRAKGPATDWASLGAGNSLGGGGSSSSSAAAAPAEEMDEEMQMALAMSLSTLEVPEPAPETDAGDKDCCPVAVRYKSETLKRTFHKNNSTLWDVFNFVEHANFKMDKFKEINPPLASRAMSGSAYTLMQQGFPKKTHYKKSPDGSISVAGGERLNDKSLASLGFQKNELLQVQLE